MCGRFTLIDLPTRFLEYFGVELAAGFTGSYNIAPSQQVLTVRVAPDSGRREPTTMRWGLVPAWAKDVGVGNKLINARAETVADKPSFRAAFRRRRCLILADSFYEWVKEGKHKQPYRIMRVDGAPFAFAGLWEVWQAAGPPLTSCTIITTAANEMMRPYHHRMPVILPPARFDAWLDPTLDDRGVLEAMLEAPSGGELTAYPVGTQVNRPGSNSPDLVEPIQLELFS